MHSRKAAATRLGSQVDLQTLALLHHYCWSSEGGCRIGVDHSVSDTGSFKVYDQRADVDAVRDGADRTVCLFLVYS